MIENPFKNIIEENLISSKTEGDEIYVNEDEQLAIDNDDFFAGLSRLSVCGSPSRSRSSSNEKHQICLSKSPPSSSSKKQLIPEKRSARQPFVINPRRVTMSFGEGGVRKCKLTILSCVCESVVC